MTQFKDYRIRITKPGDNRSTYIVRRGDDVRYMNANERPLALADLLHGEAAETRFALEDARDGTSACKAVRNVLTRLWSNNPKMCPMVEIKL
jgi:hypothetical protein